MNKIDKLGYFINKLDKWILDNEKENQELLLEKQKLQEERDGMIASEAIEKSHDKKNNI